MGRGIAIGLGLGFAAAGGGVAVYLNNQGSGPEGLSMPVTNGNGNSIDLSSLSEVGTEFQFMDNSDGKLDIPGQSEGVILNDPMLEELFNWHEGFQLINSSIHETPIDFDSEEARSLNDWLNHPGGFGEGVDPQELIFQGEGFHLEASKLEILMAENPFMRAFEELNNPSHANDIAAIDAMRENLRLNGASEIEHTYKDTQIVELSNGQKGVVLYGMEHMGYGTYIFGDFLLGPGHGTELVDADIRVIERELRIIKVTEADLELGEAGIVHEVITHSDALSNYFQSQYGYEYKGQANGKHFLRKEYNYTSP